MTLNTDDIRARIDHMVQLRSTHSAAGSKAFDGLISAIQKTITDVITVTIGETPPPSLTENYVKGDTFQTEGDIWTSGIRVLEHGNAIECHADTSELAIERRNLVLSLLTERNTRVKELEQEVAELRTKLEKANTAVESAATAMAFAPDDFSQHHRHAWMYGILIGWDGYVDPITRQTAMDTLAITHGWDAATVARLRGMRADIEILRTFAKPKPTVDLNRIPDPTDTESK